MSKVTQDEMFLDALLPMILVSKRYREEIEEIDLAGSRSYGDIPRVLGTVVHAQDRFVQFQCEEGLWIYVRRRTRSHLRRDVADPRRTPSCQLRP